MTTANESLMNKRRYPLTKDDIISGDLVNNGQLSPEQSGQFIWDALVGTTLVNESRVELMTGPTKEINLMGFNGRILRGGAIDVSDPANRSKPVPRKRELVTKKYIGSVHLPYEVVEDGVGGGPINFGGTGSLLGLPSTGFSDGVVKQIAAQVGTELQEAFLLSDTDTVDTTSFINQQDGILKLCDQHLVDQLGAGIDADMFAAGLIALPEQYERWENQMKHYISRTNDIKYRQSIGAKETADSDARESEAPGRKMIYGHGTPVQKVAYMPNSTGLLAHPKNFILGIQRKVSLETTRDPEAQEFIIVVSLRVAFQVEEPNAVVKYTNIGI